jgi:hypothetical protein
MTTDNLQDIGAQAETRARTAVDKSTFLATELQEMREALTVLSSEISQIEVDISNLVKSKEDVQSIITKIGDEVAVAFRQLAVAELVQKEFDKIAALNDDKELSVRIAQLDSLLDEVGIPDANSEDVLSSIRDLIAHLESLGKGKATVKLGLIQNITDELKISSILQDKLTKIKEYFKLDGV